MIACLVLYDLVYWRNMYSISIAFDKTSNKGLGSHHPGNIHNGSTNECIPVEAAYTFGLWEVTYCVGSCPCKKPRLRTVRP
jgi:hypothetical protein